MDSRWDIAQRSASWATVGAAPTPSSPSSSLITIKNGAPANAYAIGNLVAGIGAFIISSATLVASVYLLFPLCRSGQLRKLRVRLLIGMVISDMALGLIGSVTTASWLAGYPLKQGTRACNASGFLLTATLFSQHCWTLGITVSTFLLLKHPMSRSTRMLERYWWIHPCASWTISLLQSGLWWKYFGFSPSGGGYLCYYSAGTTRYDLDLVQFIPRGFVFAVVLSLYSRLFTFLRRPDIVNISSGDLTESGGGFLSGATSKFEDEANQEIQDLQLQPRSVGMSPKLAHEGASANAAPFLDSARRSSKAPAQTNQSHKTKRTPFFAPWEEMQLESYISSSARDTDLMVIADENENERDDALGVSRFPGDPQYSVGGPEITQSESNEGSPFYPSTMRLGKRRPNPLDTMESTGPLHRQPELDLGTPLMADSLTQLLPDSGNSMFSSPAFERRKSSVTFAPDVVEMTTSGDTSTEVLTARAPRHSSDLKIDPQPRSTSSSSFAESPSDKSMADDDETPMETMAEFFAAYQLPNNPVPSGQNSSSTTGTCRPLMKVFGKRFDRFSVGRGSKPNTVSDHRGSASSDGVQKQSAASYFNRQASLLMLYFPLAYLFIFAVSLVRLLYDMITAKPSTALTIISLWFVVSAGLVDALVFGLAEYLVKRRVRRKMPEKFIEPGAISTTHHSSRSFRSARQASGS